ncbi:hypothetical protein P43SY_010772 [Pythium insidiosum]|uniref:Uncharacterized protein n=1 Tax=Pythium insidiosum TaxID=114742 RepID=A0AAD5LR43_PYTIN|nr:hypothetical protein P43SY_010772 [Pythium insidiosum]
MAFSADPLLRHGNTHGRVVATVDQLDLHDVNADADGMFAIDLMAWRGVAGLYLLVPENDCDGAWLHECVGAATSEVEPLL